VGGGPGVAGEADAESGAVGAGDGAGPAVGDDADTAFGGDAVVTADVGHAHWSLLRWAAG